jgi:uncharacterized membrane protein
MRRRVDMDTIVGFTLQIGVTLSLVLIATGLVWHRFKWGTWQWALDYRLPATTVFGFLVADVEQATGEPARPRMLVNFGIAVLMLTPYVRVLMSMLYFAFVERNRKYAVFTAFVLAMLTYGLFTG